MPGRIFPTTQNPTRAKAAVCGWCQVTDFVQLSCRRFLRTSPLPTRHSPPTDQNSPVPDFVFGEIWEKSGNDGQTYTRSILPTPRYPVIRENIMNLWKEVKGGRKKKLEKNGQADLGLFDISISNIDCRYIDTSEKYRYRHGHF